MVILKISKVLKTAWEVLKNCNIGKNDEKMILSEINSIFKELNEFKKEYEFLKDVLKDDFRNIITTAVICYPDKSLKEAIKNFYNDIKSVVDEYGPDFKEVNKYLKVDASDLESNFFKPTAISKIAFIRKIIKNREKKECIF